MDSDRPSQPWRSGDELEAVRLEQMRHNAESARLTAASKNVRLYGSAQGNTAIAVDEPEVGPALVPQVKVTGSASGGGKYTGYLITPPAVGAAATGNLSESELGTVGTVVIRILNRREVGMATHDLASSAFLPLVFDAVYVGRAADGVDCYSIDGYQHKDCTA